MNGLFSHSMRRWKVGVWAVRCHNHPCWAPPPPCITGFGVSPPALAHWRDVRSATVECLGESSPTACHLNAKYSWCTVKRKQKAGEYELIIRSSKQDPVFLIWFCCFVDFAWSSVNRIPSLFFYHITRKKRKIEISTPGSGKYKLSTTRSWLRWCSSKHAPSLSGYWSGDTSSGETADTAGVGSTIKRPC